MASPKTTDHDAAPAKKPSWAKRILLTLLVALAVFAAVVAMQPADFRITRSATVTGPPEVAFAAVNDFRRWADWSPWETLDPNMKKVYEGPPSGEGAIYRWQGNGDVGAGSMTIVESKPAELIRIDLEFTEPFAGRNPSEFTFQPADGDKTKVTWTMAGKKNFISKAFCMFMDMDQMVGGSFEKGLAGLDEAVKKSSPDDLMPAER